jgi:transcriptional regulator with XRE-family HTH domain
MRTARVPPGRTAPALQLLGTYVEIKPGAGARLRKRRKSRDLTQEQLGMLCDRTSQAAISMLESEKMRTCTRELAELVCKRLDVELEDYFEVHGDIVDSAVPNAQQVSRRRPGRRGGRRAVVRRTLPEEKAA